MTTNLLNGWFADRAAGRGKPVYSTGTTIVPTNGVVGGGVTGALTAGTFANGASASTPKSLLDGWFCDRAPGEGKIVFGEFPVPGNVPANGPVGGGTGAVNPPAGPGGKYYFEITVVAVGYGQGTGAQLGFINPHQRDTIRSSTYSLGPLPGRVYLGGQAGGRICAQGRTPDGAVVDYSNNPAGWICGTQIINPAVAPGRWNVGDIIGVAVDTINNRFWSRNWMVTAGLGMTQLGSWEGGGNPQTPNAGWDISALTGDLIIWFGATGRYDDRIQLNPGGNAITQPFYGLNGTGVLPTGYTGWDVNSPYATLWDVPAIRGTNIAGHSLNIPPTYSYLSITSSGQDARIFYKDFSLIIPDSNVYGTAFSNSATYNTGTILMDGQNPTFPAAFYTNPIGLGPALNGPVGNPGAWESVVMGVCSNTSKKRV